MHILKEILCTPFYAIAFVGLTLTSFAGLGVYIIRGEKSEEDVE